jgi:hypothetical protein
MSPLFYARGILAKHGIDAGWSPNAICVAVVSRLPRSSDRKLFNSRVGGCGTHAELIELAATTLNAFEHRRTPLRPPPIGERNNLASERDETPGQTPLSPLPIGEGNTLASEQDDALEGPRTPYSVT